MKFQLWVNNKKGINDQKTCKNGTKKGLLLQMFAGYPIYGSNAVNIMWKNLNEYKNVAK